MSSALWQNVTYGIVDEMYSYQGTARASYGIIAYVTEELSFPTIVASVHAVTSDRERLVRLVYQCNQQHLSPIHLGEVIDDFLTVQ